MSRPMQRPASNSDARKRQEEQTRTAENDAPTYRVLSPNPGSTNGWPPPRGFGLLMPDAGCDLTPITGGIDMETEVVSLCKPCGDGDHVFHVRGACSLVQCECVIPPGLVPCVCGEQMVRPYPNDTGDHSTTECPIPPGQDAAS